MRDGEGVCGHYENCAGEGHCGSYAPKYYATFDGEGPCEALRAGVLHNLRPQFATRTEHAAKRSTRLLMP